MVGVPAWFAYTVSRRSQAWSSPGTSTTSPPPSAAGAPLAAPGVFYTLPEDVSVEQRALTLQNKKLLQENSEARSRLALPERNKERQGFTTTELSDIIAELRKENEALQRENKLLRERVDQLSGQVGTLSHQVQTQQKTIDTLQKAVDKHQDAIDKQECLMRLGGCVSLLDRAFARMYCAKFQERPPTNFFLAVFFDPVTLGVSSPEEVELWQAFVQSRPELLDPAIQQLFREIKQDRNQAAHPQVDEMSEAQVEAALVRCFPSPKVLAAFRTLLFSV